MEGEYSIPLWNVKSFQQTKDGVIYEIVTKNGRTYANITGKKGWNNIVILDPERSAISIPLGEVQMVYVQRVNPSGSVIAIVAETAFVAFGLLALVALVKSSCPFIYSYDAGAYVFDAEPSEGQRRAKLETDGMVQPGAPGSPSAGNFVSRSPTRSTKRSTRTN